ncbi:lipoyltransferase 1, mitochondrial [Pangasianodon hypophthalmus]|uniref:lipoyltransferase 1, mitochondrial n=1 Tax=Pangasianodon hypophthalmus TaxID=310915 RepID=UPI0023070331|nr:lipoyltransferase 1, mitochondrial [Pangasianodon hypophthalmus]
MILRTLSRVFLRTRDLSRLARRKSTLNSCFDESGKAGLILKSSSTDIFQNLALEDWIHERVDVQSRSILLLWRNAPAVVIGRHQNPWQECDVQLLRRTGIPVARRRSGGGTVYHDLGNINMTFFTSKKKYDRMRNLGVVTGAVKALRPNLDVCATERFDIILNGCYKISGTAARLGRTAAYHHCTLLCSADRSVLSSVLKSSCTGIKSNATPSVPSPVTNLSDHHPSLNPESLMDAIASRYNKEFDFDSPVLTVDPGSEVLMPGIQKMTSDLRKWDWVYGKTPKFSICTTFVVENTNVGLEIDIKNGVVETCVMDVPHDWLPADFVKEFCSSLTGVRFCPNEFAVSVAAFLRTISSSPQHAQNTLSLYENIVSVM